MNVINSGKRMLMAMIWKFKFFALFTTLLTITACGGHYKTTSLSGDPAKMSADTLCFHYASSKNPKFATEIDARNLDCTTLLRDNPLLNGQSGDLNNAYRIGR